MKSTLKGFFVCDKCREDCHNGVDEVGVFGPDNCPAAYFPRKQRVGCLAGYCDTPCSLQKETTDLTMEQMIDLVRYLGDYLNEFLITTDDSECASDGVGGNA
jgi:hypothetical protein